jgi:hypothetical protein
MSNFSGPELLTFQAIIFRDIVTCLNSYRSADTYTNMQILVPKMAKSNLLLDNILMGNIDALVHLWSWAMRDDTESQKLGSRYIYLLSSLSVDFKRSIEAELEKLPGRTLQDKRFEGPDRKILFYQDDEQDWVLRWEWKLNEEAPGYNLLSEFPRMTFDKQDSIYSCGRPSFKKAIRYLFDNDADKQEPKWGARLARRLAKSARKELVRTGQKRPRSRMPGAWI